MQNYSYGGRNGVEEFSSAWNCVNLTSDLIGDEEQMEFVSLEELAPFALDKIEALSIEGLRIQSRMSDEEPPCCICPQFIGNILASGGRSANPVQLLCREGVEGLQVSDARDGGSDNDGLIDLSITFDEWLRLDAGNIGDEDHNSERILNILAAHCAKCTDLVTKRLTEDVNQRKLPEKKCGLLGNNLTVALTMQLRDPLRNYEPVGVPMLVLIQVQRVFSCQMHKGNSVVSKFGEEKENDHPVQEEVSDRKEEDANKGDEEDTPLFQVSEVHIAGVNTVLGNRQLWGTTTQQQSGSRWLLASGLGKNVRHAFTKSRAIVRSSPPVAQQGDSLWSISSHFHGLGPTKRDFITPHTRNPDIFFQRPHETHTF